MHEDEKKDVDNWLYYIEILNRNNKGKVKPNNASK